MKALKDAILQDGYGLGKDIVKVDMFLNHRLDTQLMMEMGKEFHKHFSAKPIDIILTVETSGVAIAMTTAIAFGNIPVVFAKMPITIAPCSPIRMGKKMWLPSKKTICRQAPMY